VHNLDGGLGLASGKVVEYRGIQHFYLTNLTGGEGTDNLDFISQAKDMFTQAETLLHKQGLSFRDVVRTWIYVNNIERDYADLNRVRTEFFQEHGLTRLPASTGIQGATYPKERGCTMDLYTLTTNRPVEIETIHAPSMNEAAEYGSSFSRGMKVVREDRIIAYVSGTASIDNKGNIVHIGNIENQVHRMLLNVEELLATQNITPNDIVTLITYLKEPNFLDTFYKIYKEHSFPKDAPNTISTADICRPEWLCEIEAIAVVPSK
jgi:enamine deaminase RidA (YjgF/YER057c/UK114 family)